MYMTIGHYYPPKRRGDIGFGADPIGVSVYVASFLDIILYPLNRRGRGHWFGAVPFDVCVCVQLLFQMDGF